MGLVLTCVLILASSEELVRLQLRDGTVTEGTVVRIDGEGRYVVRQVGGSVMHVPYGDVLNVQILKPGEENRPTPGGAPQWPRFPRQVDLIGFVMGHVSTLPVSDREGARSAFSHALELVRAQNYAGALPLVSDAVSADPSWETVLLLRAALLAELGFSARAQEDAARVLRFNPGLVPGYEVASEIAYRRGLRGEGDELYADGISRSYGSPERDWRLGHFWLTRDPERAATCFSAYLEADPTLTQSFSVEGRLLHQARRERAAGKLERASRTFDEFFRGSPMIARAFSEEFGELLTERAGKLSDQGKAGAAARDIEEAARLMPHREAELAPRLRSLTAAELYTAARQVSTLKQAEHLREQLQRVFPVLPSEARHHLAGAYGRVCAEALRAGDVVRAVESMVAAEGIDAALCQREEVVRALQDRTDQLTASEAWTLSEALYGFDPVFLKKQCAFLLGVQLEELTGELEAGDGAGVSRKIAALEEMFGAAPGLSQLKKDVTSCEDRLRAVRQTSPHVSSGEARIAEDLLTYFPVEVGRWWEYVAGDGRRERWRVEDIRSDGDMITVRFEGQETGPGGTVPMAKDVFITAEAIFATAPSWEAGGRLLLWRPPGEPSEKARFQHGAHLHEWWYAALDDTISLGEETFRDCRHVVMGSSIVDPLTGPTRFAFESHHWYAPDVGLIRIRDDSGNAWNLVNWGRGGQEAGEEESGQDGQ